MSKLQKHYKKLKIALGLSALLLLVSVPVFAADPPMKITTGGEVCFPEETSKIMVVEFERGRLISDEIVLLKQKNDELERQIKLLTEINSIQEQQIQTLKKATETYQDLLKAQGEAYEKQLKLSKPNIWAEILQGAGYVGLGILIGLLL